MQQKCFVKNSSKAGTPSIYLILNMVSIFMENFSIIYINYHQESFLESFYYLISICE